MLGLLVMHATGAAAGDAPGLGAGHMAPKSETRMITGVSLLFGTHADVEAARWRRPNSRIDGATWMGGGEHTATSHPRLYKHGFFMVYQSS